jgi:hypothetical protein
MSHFVERFANFNWDNLQLKTTFQKVIPALDSQQVDLTRIKFLENGEVSHWRIGMNDEHFYVNWNTIQEL